MEESKVNSFAIVNSPEHSKRNTGNQSALSSNVKVFKEFLYSSNLEIDKNETVGPVTTKNSKKPTTLN